MNDLELYCVHKEKDKKEYNDYYLVWTHNNKVFDLRVRPQFMRRADISCMFARAIKCESTSAFLEMIGKSSRV